MDRVACHVIYVNRKVREERVIRANRDDVTKESLASIPPLWETDHIQDDIQPLLDAFGDVHVCATGATCISKLFEFEEGSMLDLRPTIVLLDTPHDERIPDSRTRSTSPSPSSCSETGDVEIHTPGEEVYGLNLLQKIITEAHLRSISKLVVPIPVISYPQSEESSPSGQMTDGVAESSNDYLGSLAANRRLIRRCLDLGAVDVIISPISSKCITTLEICAYRAHRDAAREQQTLMEIRRGRKRSWVGINEEKPFAYLREAMVSGLMKGICRLSADDEQISGAHISVSSDRQVTISEAVGSWQFSAHSFTDDELLVAAMDMFKHALSVPELERWRISSDQLISYLVACRAAYNSFVPYHNFRHVVDVLQATFHFLVRIGVLPPYPLGSSPESTLEKSPIAELLGPFEALTLLITAIGHDVGHPGVNNGFLVTLNAPLAQLYNDRSVLESFHCAAYSQILRRYWPPAFEDTKMRNLMISSILATDMGLHFDYMKKLGHVQEKLQANNSILGWNGRQVEEQKALACSLLIKCADISNVARSHNTALQWMHILAEEFSRQASMEGELEIQSSLLAPPKKDLVSLARAQLSFMNLFAIPLFQGVADIMPAMQYTVDELDVNKGLFERKIEEEKAKQPKDDPTKRRLMREGTFSPRTRSFVVQAEGDVKTSVPEASVIRSPEASLHEEGEAGTPGVLVDGETRAQDELSPRPSHPTMKPAHIPNTSEDYKEVNGGISTYDAAREFSSSDPFRSRSQGDSYPESKSAPSGKQRCSETTEGSVAGTFSGDWASQATSATTGKMPMSPSTRGTSIVSGGSTEQASGVPGISVDSASIKDSPGSAKYDSPSVDDETISNSGSVGKAEGKPLRKKPSRFRMKDFPFFRRHKGSSSPFPAADS